MTVRGAILDVDGTVVRGDDPVPGAAEGLAAIETAGLRRLFLSNNPTASAIAYRDRLARAGFAVEASEVMTAGTAVAHYLRNEHPGGRVHVIGEAGLLEQLDDAGVSLVDDPETADAVVVSIDRGFDYDRLSEALWALSDESVAFVGTDPDMVIPAGERPVPGSGAMIHAVAGVTGRSPDATLGKPSPVTRRLALDRLGLDPGDCLVVGDRLDTDVALGAGVGMTTVLVGTGVDGTASLDRADVTPDYVIDSLAGLEDVLGDLSCDGLS